MDEEFEDPADLHQSLDEIDRAIDRVYTPEELEVIRMAIELIVEAQSYLN